MKSVFLILVCSIVVLTSPISATPLTLTPLLAQEFGAGDNNSTENPDQDTTIQRGASGERSPSSKITPVTQNFTMQGIIMVALMAAALFPICKSSNRGR